MANENENKSELGLIFGAQTPKYPIVFHKPVLDGRSVNVMKGPLTMEPRYQGGTIDRTGATTSVDIDQGLRTYMLSVYNYMTVALVLTGVVALAVVNIPAISELFYTKVQASIGAVAVLKPLGWVALFAPLVFVFIFAARLDRVSVGSAQTMFWVFAGLMGLFIAPVLAVYTGMSIAKVFFMTAGMFGAMSLYGYTTKRDLSNWGAFLFMGIIGLFLAIIVNIFLKSPALHFAISVIGVLIFVGLTAYDTQRIKSIYSATLGQDVLTRHAIRGALNLYMNFINMFLFLLQLFGSRE